MSYKKPNTGNSMNDYFTALTDFTILSKNLLSAKDFHGFIVWFDKLEKIDKRALYMFIKKHKDEFSSDCIEFAQKRFDVPL